MIATVLGALLRCLSRRRSGWDGRGRFKSSWVAYVFGVSIGQVKKARAELVALGWIAPEASTVWVENKFGRAYRIDLGWKFGGAKPTPPQAYPGSESRPPDQTQIPPWRKTETQNPAGGPTGTCADRDQEPLPKSLPPPTLANIRPEDLTSVPRLEAIATQAVGTSEADRLKVVALAEHARRIGKNPPALFASLLRRGAWSFVTQAEEDAARRRLAAHREGGRRGASARRLTSTTLPPGRPCPVPSPVQDQPARRSTFVPDAPVGRPIGLGALLGRLGGFASGG